MLSKVTKGSFAAFLMLTNDACLWFNQRYPEIVSIEGRDYAPAAPADAPQNVIAALSATCYSKAPPDVTRLLTSGDLYKLPVGTLVLFPSPRETQGVYLEFVTVKDGPLRGREFWICLGNISIKDQPF